MTAESLFRGYRFGRFELQLDERRLLVAGTPVRLGRHAFDVLTVLVERSGHLVTKDHLLECVWPKLVVEENNLQAQVSALRKILGSDAIATISGQGYRFTPEVTKVDATATSPSARAKHNLPQQLTSFIGREKEIAEIKHLLGATRLLTLTGAGGCGKTRLAMQVVADQANAYPDGLWLVEFAALADPDLVPQTVGSVLGIKEQPGKSLTQSMIEYLAPRHLLLVLDNAEHVVGACAQLADALLRGCARLAILITSRERLGIEGELTFRVPSLSVPDPKRDATPERVLPYESARLFVERARLQRPHFTVTAENAPALASICHRLDGIALAIELAAPRVRSMSVEELSRRLDHRFGLLTGGSRTALPRHRTLRSLIDWSYDLLSDAEKALLCRASVFAGGWTLAAAEQVCLGEGIDASQVLDLLTSLADKNLVGVEEHAGITRYGLLETVRHYAQERLQQSGEEAHPRELHFDYFLDLAERARHHEVAADSHEWIEYLDAERHNFRVALNAGCSGTVDRARDSVRLVGLLYWFWASRGYWTEAEEWISKALGAAKHAPEDEGRARALRALGGIAYVRGHYQAAKGPYQQSLEIERNLGNRRQEGICLHNLAQLADSQGEPQTAENLMRQALAIARELNDRELMAYSLTQLGLILYSVANYAAARHASEESLDMWRSLGNWRTSHPLCVLAMVALAEGDNQAALEMAEEALTQVRGSGGVLEVAGSLIVVAKAAIDVGHLGRAVKLLLEGIQLRRESGELGGLYEYLEAAAAAAYVRESPILAARIWGLAARAATRGWAIRVPDRLWNERHIRAARDALNDNETFDRAWEEGHVMDIDRGVQFVLTELSRLDGDAAPDA